MHLGAKSSEVVVAATLFTQAQRQEKQKKQSNEKGRDGSPLGRPACQDSSLLPKPLWRPLRALLEDPGISRATRKNGGPTHGTFEFRTQTCLETLSVFNSVLVFPCCFFDVCLCCGACEADGGLSLLGSKQRAEMELGYLKVCYRASDNPGFICISGSSRVKS